MGTNVDECGAADGASAAFVYRDQSRVVHEGLARFFNQQTFSDITVVDPNGAKIHCHQLVLSACSRRFADMLEKGQLSGEELPVRGVDAQGLYLVIRFFYTGECQMDHTTVLPVYDAAHRLDVPGLAAACEMYIQQALRPDTACTLLQQALRFGMTGYAASCSRVIRNSFDAVIASDDFLGTDLSSLMRLLEENMPHQNEGSIFRAAWRWGMASVSRMQSMPRVFKVVKVPNLSMQDLVTLAGPLPGPLPSPRAGPAPPHGADAHGAQEGEAVTPERLHEAQELLIKCMLGGMDLVKAVRVTVQQFGSGEVEPAPPAAPAPAPASGPALACGGGTGGAGAAAGGAGSSGAQGYSMGPGGSGAAPMAMDGCGAPQLQQQQQQGMLSGFNSHRQQQQTAAGAQPHLQQQQRPPLAGGAQQQHMPQSAQGQHAGVICADGQPPRPTVTLPAPPAGGGWHGSNPALRDLDPHGDALDSHAHGSPDVAGSCAASGGHEPLDGGLPTPTAHPNQQSGRGFPPLPPQQRQQQQQLLHHGQPLGLPPRASRPSGHQQYPHSQQPYPGQQQRHHSQTPPPPPSHQQQAELPGAARGLTATRHRSAQQLAALPQQQVGAGGGRRSGTAGAGSGMSDCNDEAASGAACACVRDAGAEADLESRPHQILDVLQRSLPADMMVVIGPKHLLGNVASSTAALAAAASAPPPAPASMRPCGMPHTAPASPDDGRCGPAGAYMEQRRKRGRAEDAGGDEEMADCTPMADHEQGDVWHAATAPLPKAAAWVQPAAAAPAAQLQQQQQQAYMPHGAEAWGDLAAHGGAPRRGARHLSAPGTDPGLVGTPSSTGSAGNYPAGQGAGYAVPLHMQHAARNHHHQLQQQQQQRPMQSPDASSPRQLPARFGSAPDAREQQLQQHEEDYQQQGLDARSQHMHGSASASPRGQGLQSSVAAFRHGSNGGASVVAPSPPQQSSPQQQQQQQQRNVSAPRRQGPRPLSWNSSHPANQAGPIPAGASLHATDAADFSAAAPPKPVLHLQASVDGYGPGLVAVATTDAGAGSFSRASRVILSTAPLEAGFEGAPPPTAASLAARLLAPQQQQQQAGARPASVQRVRSSSAPSHMSSTGPANQEGSPQEPDAYAQQQQQEPPPQQQEPLAHAGGRGAAANARPPPPPPLQGMGSGASLYAMAGADGGGGWHTAQPSPAANAHAQHPDTPHALLQQQQQPHRQTYASPFACTAPPPQQQQQQQPHQQQRPSLPSPPAAAAPRHQHLERAMSASESTILDHCMPPTHQPNSPHCHAPWPHPDAPASQTLQQQQQQQHYQSGQQGRYQQPGGIELHRAPSPAPAAGTWSPSQRQHPQQQQEQQQQRWASGAAAFARTSEPALPVGGAAAQFNCEAAEPQARRGLYQLSLHQRGSGAGPSLSDNPAVAQAQHPAAGVATARAAFGQDISAPLSARAAGQQAPGTDARQHQLLQQEQQQQQQAVAEAQLRQQHPLFGGGATGAQLGGPAAVADSMELEQLLQLQKQQQMQQQQHAQMLQRRGGATEMESAFAAAAVQALPQRQQQQQLAGAGASGLVELASIGQQTPLPQHVQQQQPGGAGTGAGGGGSAGGTAAGSSFDRRLTRDLARSLRISINGCGSIGDLPGSQFFDSGLVSPNTELFNMLNTGNVEDTLCPMLDLLGGGESAYEDTAAKL